MVCPGLFPGYFRGAPPCPGVTTSGPPSKFKKFQAHPQQPSAHSSPHTITIRQQHSQQQTTTADLFFFFSAKVCALWPLQLCRVQGVGCRAACLQNKYFYKLQMWQGQRLKAVFLYFSGIFRQ